MLEVEAKGRLASAEDARARLRALGATRVGEQEQRDAYFAHPARDFARTDEALRVRVQGEAAELTYKGPKLGARAKSREERTVRVADAGAAGALLEALGFRRVAEVRKRRETWKLAGAEVALDEVEGLGAFAEVEVPAEPAEREAAEQEVLELLERLGAGPSMRTSYLEMLLEKGPAP